MVDHVLRRIGFGATAQERTAAAKQTPLALIATLLDYEQVPNDVDAMSGYWARFAATGDPNTDELELIHWPVIGASQADGTQSEKHIVFDWPIRWRIWSIANSSPGWTMSRGNEPPSDPTTC